MAEVRITKDTYTIEPLHQWDVNQELRIYGLSLPAAPEVHFAHDSMDKAIVRQAAMDAAGVVSVGVPNALLQKRYRLNAYVCISDSGTFETLYKIVIPVEARPQPSDYEFTDEAGVVYSLNALAAEVVTLGEGSAATVTKTTKDGVTLLTFGIPRGATGPRGEKGEKGDPGDPGQADWSINDPTVPGYVKNRFCYKEDPSKTLTWDGKTSGLTSFSVGASEELNFAGTPYYLMPRTAGNPPTAWNLSLGGYVTYQTGADEMGDEGIVPVVKTIQFSSSAGNLDSDTYPGATLIGDMVIVVHEANTLVYDVTVAVPGVYFKNYQNLSTQMYPSRVTEMNTAYFNLDNGVERLPEEFLPHIAATKQYVDEKAVQSDWNQNDESAADFVKNRPFYTVVSEFTWDGNTDGLVCIEDAGVYKISDESVTLESLLSGFTFGMVSPDGEQVTTLPSADLPVEFLPQFVVEVAEGLISIIDMIYVATRDVEYNGVSFTKGIYFMYDASGPAYVSLLSCESVTKLDAKYIPELPYTTVDEVNANAAFLKVENPTGTGSLSLNRKADTTVGRNSVAIGKNNEAISDCDYAEGEGTKASGGWAHAEGYYTTASGNVAHAEGKDTEASGSFTHAEGSGSVASGSYSHAEGRGTIAGGMYQHVQGIFNVATTNQNSFNDTDLLHIVGNGTSDSARSNAHTLDKKGNAWFAGAVEGTSIILTSSTSGSTKRFKITVDDSGTLTAAEVT